MAKNQNKLAKVGSIAFIIGVILAVIAGFFAVGNAIVVSTLVVLGLVVGLLNVTEKETQSFILTSVALVIVASMAGTFLGSVPVIGVYLTNMFSYVIAYITPATIIVGLKAIYNMARD